MDCSKIVSTLVLGPRGAVPVLTFVPVSFLSVSTERMYPGITKSKIKIKNDSFLLTFQECLQWSPDCSLYHWLDLGKRSSSCMGLINNFHNWKCKTFTSHLVFLSHWQAGRLGVGLLEDAQCSSLLIQIHCWYGRKHALRFCNIMKVAGFKKIYQFPKI